MIFDKIKTGFFGEKYRVQFYSLRSLILYSIAFIALGILFFFNQPLELFVLVLLILIFDIGLVLFSKMLLIYNDGFVVSTITKASSDSLEHIPFENMKRVYIHIGGGRGSNGFTFYYNYSNEKRSVGFINVDIDKSVEILHFLFKQGVTIYVDSEKYGEAVFGVNRNLFHKVNIKYKTWFTCKH